MPDFLNGPVWLAKYGPMPSRVWLRQLGLVPENIVLWQMTGSGEVIGEHPVDRSYFMGALDELAAWPGLARFPTVSAPAASVQR